MIRADDPRSKQRQRMRTGFALACACLVMVWLGAVMNVPYRMAARMDADNERLEHRNADLRMKNQELRRHAAELATDSGMEREARKLGYVRKGEEPLVVPP